MQTSGLTNAATNRHYIQDRVKQTVGVRRWRVPRGVYNHSIMIQLPLLEAPEDWFTPSSRSGAIACSCHRITQAHPGLVARGVLVSSPIVVDYFLPTESAALGDMVVGVHSARRPP